MAGKPPPSSASLKRIPIYTSRTVAGTIKKFDHQKPPKKPPISEVHNTSTIQRKIKNNGDGVNHPSKNKLDIILTIKTNETNHQTISHPNPSTINSERPSPKIEILPPENGDEAPGKISNPRASKVDAFLQKLEKTEDGENVFKTGTPTVRYRSPSPSLLRKTQAVIAKEQCTELYRARINLRQSEKDFLKSGKQCAASKNPKSPNLGDRRDKGKSESYQKASAFWNAPKT